MSRRFSAGIKKLSARYNKRIFLVNIPSLALIITLAVISYFSKDDIMPIKYYSFFFTILTFLLGYSLVTVFIGSALATVKLDGHKKHTFIHIKNNFLIISKYKQTVLLSPDCDQYKQLDIIKLDEIEDIYLFGKKIIIVAPTRKITERADFLDYDIKDGELFFCDSWNSSCAGEMCAGVEIGNLFKRPMAIAKTIERCQKNSLEKQRKRSEFRERMLSMANSEDFRKARQRINRKKISK
ncbi:MAG: hypothetical protein ACI4KD_06345 [Oscillospiraceae bacterium]